MTPLEFILIPFITGVPTSLSLSGELLSSMLSRSTPQISPQRPSCCLPFTDMAWLFLSSAEASMGNKIYQLAYSAWLLPEPLYPSLFLPSVILLRLSAYPVSLLQSAHRLLTVHTFQIAEGIRGKKQHLAHLSFHSRPFSCCFWSAYVPTQVFRSLVQKYLCDHSFPLPLPLC